MRVRRTGQSYAHPLAVLVASPSRSPAVRIGVSAGRAVGGAADRNRAKRRLREAVRPLLPTVKPGWDIIFLARRPLAVADWAEVRAAVQGLLHKADVLDIDE